LRDKPDNSNKAREITITAGMASLQDYVIVAFSLLLVIETSAGKTVNGLNSQLSLHRPQRSASINPFTSGTSRIHFSKVWNRL